MNSLPSSFKAPVAYLAGTEKDPQTLVFPKSSGKDTVRPHQIDHLVNMNDIRNSGKTINLWGQGFELVKHQTRVSDLFDNAKVIDGYYPEMQEFLKKHLGASDVFVFDHNQRSKVRADMGVVGMRYPVASAHVDYTRTSGGKRAMDILSDVGKEEYSNNHLEIINVWRPIRGPVEDIPLAVCSGASISDQDLVETPIKHFAEESGEAPNHAGSIYSLKYNIQHQWYYVSNMEPSEVLLLKNWHSKNGKGVLNAPHTGFHNPLASINCKSRESIEVRALIVYS